jgi:hypothetical protein
MDIPAGAPETAYSFAVDAATVAFLGSGGAIAQNRPFTVYSAMLHMHLHGTKTTLSVHSPAGADACLLDIPRWDFHWQGTYAFTTPKTVNPREQLRIECHWDNSSGNQPEQNGPMVPPRDLNWGEGTTDEMCVSFLYATQ